MVRRPGESIAIETDPESNQALLVVGIPSHNLSELKHDQAKIHELTVQGLQRVIDARSKNAPLYFDQGSIKKLNPESRKEAKRMAGGMTALTLSTTAMIYVVTRHIFGEPVDIIAPAVNGLAYSGGSWYKLRQQRRYLARRDADSNWHPTTPKAQAREDEHFKAALRKTAGLGPLMTVSSEA